MGDPAAEPAPQPLRRRNFAAVVALILVAGALLRPWPGQFKFRHGGDCVRYLTWSRVVKEKGLAAFPELVIEYRQKWVGFPPPTRWAWLALIAGTMKVWSAPGDEYHPLVLWAWLPNLLSLLPLALWLRRLAPPAVALLALGLCATSPVMRAMAHFPLPDSLAMLSILTLLAVTAEWLAAPRRWHLGVIALSTLLTVTTREISFIAVIAAYALVWRDKRARGRWQKEPIWAMAVGAVVATGLTMALAGGPKALFLIAYDVVHGALFTTGSAPYVSGPYYRYLVDFMIVSPVMMVAAIAAVGPMRRSERLKELIGEVGLASLVLGIGFALLPKTLRYVMPIEAALRIFAAAAVWMLWLRRRWYGVALALALFGHDVVIHWQLWGKDQIYDPVTWGMAKYLGMIP